MFPAKMFSRVCLAFLLFLFKIQFPYIKLSDEMKGRVTCEHISGASFQFDCWS